MEKIRIESLLCQTNKEIEHLENKELRAKELLRVLEIEFQNNKNLDLLSSAQKGLTEMINEMNKSEMLTEIEYSKTLIHHFLDTGKFDLISIPQNSLSIGFAEKMTKMKDLLIIIINKVAQN
jgi:hypothetical protein